MLIFFFFCSLFWRITQNFTMLLFLQLLWTQFNTKIYILCRIWNLKFLTEIKEFKRIGHPTQFICQFQYQLYPKPWSKIWKDRFLVFMRCKGLSSNDVFIVGFLTPSPHNGRLFPMINFEKRKTKKVISKHLNRFFTFVRADVCFRLPSSRISALVWFIKPHIKDDRLGAIQWRPNVFNFWPFLPPLPGFASFRLPPLWTPFFNIPPFHENVF